MQRCRERDRERERERKREKDREKEKEKERDIGRVCEIEAYISQQKLCHCQ